MTAPEAFSRSDLAAWEQRRGGAVVEAVVALILGLFLVHLGLRTVEELRARQAQTSRRVDALAAARITRSVLRGELDRGGGADWTIGADSIRLRAFRGTGVVCWVGGLAVEVAYVGDRLPEPSKDSVEVITADGAIVRVALAGAAPSSTPCATADPRESVMTWSLSGSPPPDAVVARLYESGSYHFSGSALRYRRGAGGRQPLTAPVWQAPATGFLPVGSSVLMTLSSSVRQGPAGTEFLTWLRR